MDFRIETNQFWVPSELVTKYMPEVNSGFLKIYLYILYTVQTGGTVNAADGARALDIFEKDFARGVDYWVSKGAFIKTDSGFIIKCGSQTQTAVVQKPAAKAPVISEREAAPVISESKSYDISQITNAIDTDTELSNMVTLAQDILGKTINTDDLKTLYWFYDYLKFPAEVILMLLEYCAGMDKRKMKYIEAVALTWKERGIDTAEKADAYMKEIAQNNKRVYELRKILGITNRALSQSEMSYIQNWLQELGMGEEMVALAYDYCVMAINKLSFQYMNRIITRWSENGIFTMQAAELDHEQYKQVYEDMKKSQPQKKRNQASNRPKRNESKHSDSLHEDNYDHAAMEKMMWDNFE